MPEKLARLLRRPRLDARQLRPKLFRLAGGSPKFYRGASVLLSPGPVRCRQLLPQLRLLRRAGPHTTRHDTTRHNKPSSRQHASWPFAGMYTRTRLQRCLEDHLTNPPLHASYLLYRGE